MRREINMCKIGETSKVDNNKTKKEAKAYKQSREETIITDPNGSYTGINLDGKYAKPIQDVDDL